MSPFWTRGSGVDSPLAERPWTCEDFFFLPPLPHLLGLREGGLSSQGRNGLLSPGELSSSSETLALSPLPLMVSFSYSPLLRSPRAEVLVNSYDLAGVESDVWHLPLSLVQTLPVAGCRHPL